MEDFHYLPAAIQREFASDLKAFYERPTSVSFIIVGVWLEANRLIVYNGDLAGRLTSIPADTWQMHELDEVVRRGQPLRTYFSVTTFEPNSQRDVSSMWASSKKP